MIIDGQLYISQSLLKDWENMCGVAFKVKHFTPFKNEEDNPFYIGNKDVVVLGNIYEQSIIGISRGGKTTKPSPELAKKPIFNRMKEQAKLTKEWLRSLNGRIIGVQERIKASFEWNGVQVFIVGHLDIRFQDADGTPRNIDLKLSGDRDASFGDFQWKNLDRLTYDQPKQYNLLLHLETGFPVDRIPFDYHIGDTSTAMKVKVINVMTSEQTIEFHKERLYEAYIGISEALELDYFEPRNDYDRCSVCPIKEDCKYRNKTPLIEYVEI